MLRASAAALLCTALCVGSAHAQAAAAAAPEATPTTYEATVLAGTRRIVVRDFAAAIVILREVATHESTRPEAYCRLGDAQLAEGVFEEARAAYETCERFAGVEKNAHHVALALVGLARVLERENKPQEERDAWQRVVANVQEPAALSLAKGRLLVLDAWLAQASAQEQVRARIAEREKLAAEAPVLKP